MESLSVLYFVGEIAPTSVPLEVVDFIEGDGLHVRIVAFSQSDYQEESSRKPLTQIGARNRFDLRAVHRLYRCITGYRPDVIHVHHTMSAFWASLFGSLHGAKIVRTEHNNANFRTGGQLAINAVSQALADLVLCNSRNTYQSLPGWKKALLGDRWRVVYNGVNVNRIEQASSEAPPFEVGRSQPVTIGSVGRLIDQKNYKRLLEAFAEVVPASENGLRLVIIGDGQNRSDLEDRIGQLGLGDHVMLTGEVERDEVYAALHAFDMFVMPSLWEGFCNAAVEAMAAGLPIVCSDISTLREVVGDTALYADPKDPSDMARAMTELLVMDSSTRNQWGEKARERATERFTIERTAEKYVEAYHEVAEARVS